MDDIRKQIIYKPLGELKPYKRNPRKNDGAVDAVAASIKEFGFKVPIVIDANIAGYEKVAHNTDVFGNPLQSPTWICGDSQNIDTAISGGDFDMLLTCPPYFDLEQYSDNPADISNMSYDDFLAAYETILTKSIAKVKDNGFIAIVVGEVRDDDGIYRNFIGDTVEAVKRAGAAYYNEIVLVTMLGTLPIRIRRQFEVSRKVGNTHQKALVFLKSKGDEKALKDYLESFFGNAHNHADEKEYTRISQREGGQKERR